MSTILLVTSSPRGPASYSTRVAHALVERLRVENPGATVVVRDLAREPLPHIGEAFVGGLFVAPEARTPAQAAEVARSDALVAELFAADTIVIASAMINFAPTSTLKTWFDHVARAGVTFRYTAEGVAEGLVTAKKIYLVESRGGIYSEGPAKVIDFQEPYIRHMLGFLGMTDVVVVPVEGTVLGPEIAEKALNGALSRVSGSVLAEAA
jgi:FMN-dependent NADH-azoreductase